MHPASSRRILIADDNVDAASVAADLLRLHGYDVQVVFDGDEALVAAHAFRPHMVILDINMPRMNGYEAAATLRADPPSGAPLLLVALTARNHVVDIELAKAAGFHHHLAKPAKDLAKQITALFDASDEAERTRAELADQGNVSEQDR